MSNGEPRKIEIGSLVVWNIGNKQSPMLAFDMVPDLNSGGMAFNCLRTLDNTTCLYNEFYLRLATADEVMAYKTNVERQMAVMLMILSGSEQQLLRLYDVLLIDSLHCESDSEIKGGIEQRLKQVDQQIKDLRKVLNYKPAKLNSISELLPRTPE